MITFINIYSFINVCLVIRVICFEISLWWQIIIVYFNID